MKYIFLPEITNIIISFFNPDNDKEFKTIIDFFFCSKKSSLDFLFMKNIFNIPFLESALRKIVDSDREVDIKTVKRILAKIDPSKFNNRILRSASSNGHEQIVKLLLKDTRVKANDFNDAAICNACINGHTKIVELLLKDTTVNPCARNNFPIKRAAMFGYIDIVKLFVEKNIKIVDEPSSPLIIAAGCGHLHIVKYLLENTLLDPSYRNNSALRFACKHVNIEIVKELLNHEKVNPNKNPCEVIISCWEDENSEIPKIILNNFC